MSEDTRTGQVNIPLLRKAVEWAEAEAARGVASQWYQGSWSADYREIVSERLWNGRTLPEAQDGEAWEAIMRDHRIKVEQVVAEATCGTAYCIAGYVAHVSGFVDADGWLDWERALKQLGLPSGGWATIAAALLGIDPFDAEPLFAAANTVEQVREIAEEIAGGLL